MTKGFVYIASVKSVVSIETGRLTEDQFRHVKYVLGETFGSVMVSQPRPNRIDVMWPSRPERRGIFSRTPAQITPERLHEIIHEQLEAHDGYLKCDVRMRADKTGLVVSSVERVSLSSFRYHIAPVVRAACASFNTKLVVCSAVAPVARSTHSVL